MQTFWVWLVNEEKAVPRGVMQGYDRAFQDALQQLIQRTENQTLRKNLEDMLDCPIKTSRGTCRGFAEYIVAALLKNNIHRQYDIEAALSYVFEKMMMDRGEAKTVFGGFEERPDYVEGNPLQARFMKYLQFAVANIRRGKIPRLANVERRPQDTVSISQGRQRPGDPSLGISPETIPARPSTDTDLTELIDSITTRLRRKEAAYGLPLADVFKAILSGMNGEEQRKQFGDRSTRIARQVIAQTIEDHARSSENYALLNLLKRPVQARRPVVSPKPKLPDTERDYASIASVIDRLGRPVGSADLGRYRRRWLEYPPRNPSSGHRNRLEEVLARMVQDGVLKPIQTVKGAILYVPGPNYRSGVAV